MNYKLLIAVAAFLATATMVPLAHAQGYPYSYFTGTSYLTGPNYYMGGGGYSTGPVGIYSQSFNPYSAYGPGTISYNPMTGQGSFGDAGYGSQYGYNQYGYGSQYGGYGGYGGNTGYGATGSGVYAGNGNTTTFYGSNNSYGGSSGCNSYIPTRVCGLINGYSY